MLVRNFLKFSPFIVLTILNFLALSAAHAHEGGTSGGGGDPVEPLFFKAQKDAAKIINLIKPDKIANLRIDESYKNWLKQGSRLQELQFFTGAMQLSFQEAPCFEESAPRGACFDNSNPNQPRMIISRTFNRITTPDQAEALVLHEAGHFTGEMNHLFLSKFGEEMAALPHPTTYKATAWEKIEKITAFGDCLQYTGCEDPSMQTRECGFAPDDCFSSGRIGIACYRAEQKATELAREKCLAAGNLECNVISSAVNGSKDHTPLIGTNWAECTRTVVISNQPD